MPSIAKKVKSIGPRKSILKNPLYKTFTNGCFVIPTKPKAEDKAVRFDFYGNSIDQKKNHRIFFNMTANCVIMVESLKKFNRKEQKKPKKKKGCVIF